MEILNALYDSRSSCLSLLANMSLSEYKRIVYPSFTAGGNLSGQRDVIKRSSVAAKIRKRMHDDFIAGAIFPHVVVGILQNEESYSRLIDCVNRDIPIDLTHTT